MCWQTHKNKLFSWLLASLFAFLFVRRVPFNRMFFPPIWKPKLFVCLAFYLIIDENNSTSKLKHCIQQYCWQTPPHKLIRFCWLYRIMWQQIIGRKRKKRHTTHRHTIEAINLSGCALIGLAVEFGLIINFTCLVCLLASDSCCLSLHTGAVCACQPFLSALSTQTTKKHSVTWFMIYRNIIRIFINFVYVNNIRGTVLCFFSFFIICRSILSLSCMSSWKRKHP